MIYIDKVVLNIGVGEPGEKLEKAYKLLEKITGHKPVKTKAKRRIPAFHIRPGLEIGVKVTLRHKEAEEMLGKLLKAVDNELKQSQFSGDTFSFGIKEYIYIPGLKYDPSIGIMGMDVCVHFKRHGYSKKMPNRHRVKPEEVMAYIKEKYGVKIV